MWGHSFGVKGLEHEANHSSFTAKIGIFGVTLHSPTLLCGIVPDSLKE